MVIGPLNRGQLVLMRHGDPSVYGKAARSDTYACRWVNLDGQGLAEHLEVLRQRHGDVLTLGDPHPLIDQLAHLQALADPHAGTPRTTMAHAVHTFVMMLYEQAQDRLRQRMKPVERAIQQLTEQPCRPWSLKALAAEVGVSREHLSREFIRRVGRSPHAFLCEARTRRALRLLQDTDLPIADVAEQSGFPNTHNLARQVRAQTGCSPSALRAIRPR